MNPHRHTNRPSSTRRFAICSSLALTAAMLAAGASASTPSQGAAPRCGVCVVAVPALIDVAGVAMIGAAAGEAIDNATEAVHRVRAVHTGVRIAKHPGVFRPGIRWANGNTRTGRAIWRHINGRLVRVYRWLRRSYTLPELRRKLPKAAIACVVSGTIAGIHSGSVEQAGWSCLEPPSGSCPRPRPARPPRRADDHQARLERDRPRGGLRPRLLAGEPLRRRHGRRRGGSGETCVHPDCSRTSGLELLLA